MEMTVYFMLIALLALLREVHPRRSNTQNAGTIVSCRDRGFKALESIAGYLSLEPVTGSYGEQWSVRKVLRRFIWHDRIHAKAMYRMGIRTFGADAIPDIFGFTR